MLQELKLGDLCTLRAGCAFKTHLQGNKTGQYPFIKVSDMNLPLNEVCIRDANNWIDEGVRAEIKAKPLPPGTTVFAKIGEALRHNRVRHLVMDTIVDNNMMGAIPNRDVVDPKFLYYLLSNFDIAATATGTALPYLTVSTLAETAFLVPSLSIQRRIAGILSAYDELIENSQRRIRILETMARALYREWFVHFRFPGHDHPAGQPDRTAAGRPAGTSASDGASPSVPRVPSPLGEIPEGWEVKKLESLMTSHIGGGWGKEVPDDDHTEPAWVIRGTDIPGARGSQVAGIPHRFHTPSNLRSRRLAAGDIVFEVSGGSKGQPVGRTLFFTPQLMSAFDGDVICASFCKRICPDTSIYGAELLYLSFLEGYESGEIEQFQVQSTGISNFKWTEYITKTARVVPPESLRSRFREQVAPIFAEIATLGLQTQTLRRTRDLLLPRLLSGQIDVEAIDCA